MRLYDQHLHSRHSFDSRTEPAANVETALVRGLAGLTFTEHFDTHPDDWPGCVYDDEAYSADIERLRRDYQGDIFIGKGVEICFQPDKMEFILDFLDRHRFDVVLLSVHYFADRAVHVRENWVDVGPADGTRLYLENVLEAVRFCERLHRERGRVFDILSHLDFVKRYTKRWFDVVHSAENIDLYEEILKICLAADLIPEINTSTLRRGLDETMPGPFVVRRYAELGGTMMSLGSDAHAASDIGAGFDHAAAMLREAGIHQTVWFRGREPIPVGLA